MAGEQDTKEWTGKRYTGLDSFTTHRVAVERSRRDSYREATVETRLVADGLWDPMPLVAGETRSACARNVITLPKNAGTFGTTLILEAGGKRVAISGQDALVPDSRYDAEPTDRIDVVVGAEDFREILAAVDEALDRPADPAEGSPVTIRRPPLPDLKIGYVLPVAGILIGAFAIATAAEGMQRDGAVLGNVVLAAIGFAPLLLFGVAHVVALRRRRRARPGISRLVIGGDRIEVSREAPSPSSRSFMRHQVEVARSVRTVSGSASGQAHSYPVLSLDFGEVGTVVMTTVDTMLLDRVDWPDNPPPTGRHWIVGPAELVFLDDLLAR